MPQYRYTGKKPMFYGSQFVEFGMVVELSDRPNRLFEPIGVSTPVPTSEIIPATPASLSKRSRKEED